MLGVDEQNRDIIEGIYADELYDSYMAHFGVKPRKAKLENEDKN